MMVEKAPALGRVVAVEEHFNLPWLTQRIPEEAARLRGYFSRDMPYGRVSMPDKMANLQDRLAELDAADVTVQVLSLDGPGADLLPPKEAVTWARDANDSLAGIIHKHPHRYAGFTHLPLTDPNASAGELERAVSKLKFKGALIRGATNGKYLDHSSFTPLLERAAMLGVPLYLHPAPSPRPARDALFNGLPGDLGFWLSISGWGRHQIQRYTFSVCFSPERSPSTQISKSLSGI